MKLRVSSINLFPSKNKENGVERNTCQKRLLDKIVLKQTMWRVYRRTRKEEDCANYKEAFNAATTKIRQSKRSYEQKLACNIKMTARVFMHMSGVNKAYKTRFDH